MGRGCLLLPLPAAEQLVGQHRSAWQWEVGVEALLAASTSSKGVEGVWIGDQSTLLAAWEAKA